jgi:hypothetical protein
MDLLHWAPFLGRTVQERLHRDGHEKKRKHNALNTEEYLGQIAAEY